MSRHRAAAVALSPPQRVSPVLLVACGAILMVGAGLLQWFGTGEETAAAVASSVAAAARQTALDKAAERQAKARAEREQQAIQKAAIDEEARRASMADSGSEVKALSDRDETARRKAAVEEAQRAAVEAEEAWKRFYKPSATCKNPDARATVECVNEYIKAKREFEASRANGTPKAGS